MPWKSKLIKPYASYISSRVEKQARNAVADQLKTFRYLMGKLSLTQIGQDLDAKSILSHKEFKEKVRISEYETIKPYINKIIDGEESILWPGRPRYFAKTSGTTSGVKYIPITKQSIPNHFGTARNALFHFAVKNNQSAFLDGKMIFLSGSPELEEKGGIPTGRLSGIVNHFVPGWLRTNQLPSYDTNCIEDWEIKLDRIVEETIEEDMRLISGIPPWVQMYYERLLEQTGKQTIKEVFPNFSVFVYGGVNFQPYRSSLEELTGPGIHYVETYPASEGFIAFQDGSINEGLLLNSNSGIFFEFIPVSEIHNPTPTRLHLGEIELGENYVVILSTNAGLWAYNLGDTVEFVSKDPYRIIVTGRVKHFISAFGEHVISKEVDQAMNEAMSRYQSSVVEFTVSPQVNPTDSRLPYHEWFIEFEKIPEDLDGFATALDISLQEQNIYYKDLRDGKILTKAVIRVVKQDGFREFMKNQGKLGGQNKVPRLTNDRIIVDQLASYIE